MQTNIALKTTLDMRRPTQEQIDAHQFSLAKVLLRDWLAAQSGITSVMVNKGSFEERQRAQDRLRDATRKLTEFAKRVGG